MSKFFQIKKERLFKYFSVGLSGTVLNVSILFILVHFFALHYFISAVVAYLFSISNNFIWNKVWTFKEKLEKDFTEEYFEYFSIGIVVILFNLAQLWFYTEVLGVYFLLSNLIAIGIGGMGNFLLNKNITFKK